MLRKRFISSHTVSGLRTRYFPKSRIGQGLVSMAPWLNLVLLFGLFMLVDSRFVLQPGVVVELPEAVFSGGLRSPLKAVILSLQTGAEGAREETVVFGDDHFRVAQERQMARFKRLLGNAAQAHPERGLVILADRQVRLDTVVRMFNMAREAGVREVDLGTRESAPLPSHRRTPDP